MSMKNGMELGMELAKAGFKEKHEGSYLGIFWYLLNPLLMFMLLLLIFSDRLGANIPSYPLYLLIGIIMFNFFQKVTVESTKIINDNRRIVKSIKFPMESLVISIVIKTFFSHIFEIMLFIGFMIFFHNSIIGIIYYPLILIFFCIFIYGSSLTLSALSVHFTDIENIWSFVSYILWLGTPIFYSIGGQTRLLYANMLNPVYYFIAVSRDVVIYNRVPELWLVAGMILHALVFLVVGTLIFNKLKVRFAELV